jgi:hypothetical protein
VGGNQKGQIMKGALGGEISIERLHHKITHIKAGTLILYTTTLTFCLDSICEGQTQT